MGMYTYQIEYISETPGVSPKLNFRKQMNMLFKAYMMGYAAVLLNPAYQQCRVNPKGVNPNLTSIFEKNVRFCAFVGGSATRAATRYQYKFNLCKYNLNNIMKLLIEKKTTLFESLGHPAAPYLGARHCVKLRKKL